MTKDIRVWVHSPERARSKCRRFLCDLFLIAEDDVLERLACDRVDGGAVDDQLFGNLDMLTGGHLVSGCGDCNKDERGRRRFFTA